MLKALYKQDEVFFSSYLVYSSLRPFRHPDRRINGGLARYLPLNLLLITKCTDQFV